MIPEPFISKDDICSHWREMDIPDVGNLLIDPDSEYDEVDIISFFLGKKFDKIFDNGDIEMMPFYYLTGYASCYYLGGYFLYLLGAFEIAPQEFPYRFSNNHLARYMASEKVLGDSLHLDCDQIRIIILIYKNVIENGVKIGIGVEDGLLLVGLINNLNQFTGRVGSS